MYTSKPSAPDLSSDVSRDDAGGGRRAYVRYPLVLDVTLTAGGRKIPCQVRDFCMGGMLLQYPRGTGPLVSFPVSADERVLVQGTVPLAEGGREVAFQARVARRVPEGVGLAFIEPDHDALRAMQQYALQYTGGVAPRSGPAQLGRRFADIIAGCNRIVQETMDSLLAQLEQRLDRHLFDLSRDAGNPGLQNEFFTASELVRNEQSGFADAIRATFKAQLESAQEKALSLNAPGGPRLEELSLDNLSLLNDEDLGVWLAVSEVTSKAEERYKEALALLQERLSVLFAVRIGHANNPYGPALFAESFQAGLGRYHFKDPVNAACYALFKDLLIALLADLYAKLNAILIQYGILPDLKTGMLHRPVAQKGAAPRPRPATPPAPRAEPAPRAAPVLAAPRRERQAVAGSDPEELYQVVQDLRTLKQQLVRQRAAAGAVPDRTAEDTAPGYTTSELMTVLDALQAHPGEGMPGGAEMVPLKARIVSALDAREGGASRGRKLNPRDGNLLEITGDLLGAMQSDPLVADSVKPWLKRLELPVVRMALVDPTLFFDHGHVVRQVVNNVAQLEYYRPVQGQAGQNAISVAIEALLEKAAGEGAEGVETFREIQDRLEKLIKIQDQAYADNIAELTRACEQAPPVPEAITAEEGEAVTPAARQKWLMHARRLRAGDNLLQTESGRPPQRLRLGWIDADKSVYVLVNLRGLTERVLAVDDVATLMGCGVLEPQTNAADPAMDRAQYAIMQDLYRQVLHESTHDGVTGLINRREFERMVRDAVASAKRDGLRHVLIFADIDKFSAINNRCGYGGGDQLLQAVVAILREGLPEQACLARLGGDQIGILLKECALDDALAIAERQIKGVAGYQMEWKEDSYSATVSMGLVSISAASGDVDELLHASEASCDIAKDMGGNRLQVYHAGHARIAHETELMKWVGKIDKMLAEDALEIRCQRIQPIASDGSEPPHFEILVGVKDEAGKVQSPVEFIRAAEWYRRMGAVDRYVIGHTLGWLERHPEVVAGLGGVSINLSGQSLNEEDFYDFIVQQLDAVSMPREKICFEITETVGIANLTDAALFIERIRETGCRFSLDDFGSGMSSYGYLKHLPVDVVKIDGAFVKNLTAESSDYAVVKSVTEIAHFMNKKVVAEFVEHDEALELLREIGVDYVQGYMIDRPAPIERLLALAADPA